MEYQKIIKVSKIQNEIIQGMIIKKRYMFPEKR